MEHQKVCWWWNWEFKTRNWTRQRHDLREKGVLSLSLSLSLSSPKDLLFLCGRNNAGQRHAEHTKSKTISREGDVWALMKFCLLSPMKFLDSILYLSCSSPKKFNYFFPPKVGRYLILLPLSCLRLCYYLHTNKYHPSLIHKALL